MPNVKLLNACIWDGRRHEAGDVISVDDRTAELNASWMSETTAAPSAEPQKKTGKADKETKD
jgi:hypothetical protein